MATIFTLGRHFQQYLFRRLNQRLVFELEAREMADAFVAAHAIIEVYPVIVFKIGVRSHAQQAVFDTAENIKLGNGRQLPGSLVKIPDSAFALGNNDIVIREDSHFHRLIQAGNEFGIGKTA
ncbi:hypothetical protein D3C87_1752450 [compost metagenome]